MVVADLPHPQAIKAGRQPGQAVDPERGLDTYRICPVVSEPCGNQAKRSRTGFRGIEDQAN